MTTRTNLSTRARLAIQAMAITLLGAFYASAQGAPPATPITLLYSRGLQQVIAQERGKIVVLSLWATWCAPCLRELPMLVDIEKSLAANGVRLIGVAMDEPADLTSRVIPFRNKYFPALRSYASHEPEMDTLVSVIDPAWNEILPTTYIIGRNGKLLHKIQGTRSAAEFRAVISAALTESR